MRRLTVKDVMTTDVVTVGRRTPFTAVARLLAERRLNALPVVSDDGELVGIVSMSDLLHKEAHKDDAEGVIAFTHRAREARHKATGTTAADVMTANPVVITPDTTVVAAARAMSRRSVKQLPVVENDDLVGIVSRSDLVRAFLRPDETIRAEVRAELRDRGLPKALTVEVTDGVVTITGKVDHKTRALVAARTADRVDGVVAVRNAITYSYDDTILVTP